MGWMITFPLNKVTTLVMGNKILVQRLDDWVVEAVVVTFIIKFRRLTSFADLEANRPVVAVSNSILCRQRSRADARTAE